MKAFKAALLLVLLTAVVPFWSLAWGEASVKPGEAAVDVRYPVANTNFEYLFRFNPGDRADVVYLGAKDAANKITWETIWSAGKIDLVFAAKDLPALPRGVTRVETGFSGSKYVDFATTEDIYIHHSALPKDKPVKLKRIAGNLEKMNFQLNAATDKSGAYAYAVVTVKSDKDAVTAVVRKSDMSAVIMSKTYSGDPKLEISVDQDVVSVKRAPRSVDLLHFESESEWIPSGDGTFMDQSGKPADAWTEVNQSFDDFEDISGEPVILSERDERLVKDIKTTLSKPERASAVILGKSGTGKTAIAKEALADLPRTWRKKVLTPTGLGSGTRFTGMFDGRVDAMIAASRAAPTVWFADELHSLKGLGTHSESSNDFFEKVKPYLNDGTLRLLGTDTEMEFNETFTDPAIRRRLTMLSHEPPTPEELRFKVNRWLKMKKYEAQPADEIEYLISTAEDFNAVENEPGRSIGLLEMAMAVISERGQEQQLTREIIDAAAAKMYKIDPGLRDVDLMREKIRKLPELLNQYLIGQGHIKANLIQQSRIALANLHDGVGPRVSMFIPGVPGLGKTELAKAYALAMGLPYKVIEMSRYRELPVEQLMTDIAMQLRINPYSVLIFDEIEKARPNALEALLTFMSAERFTAYENRPGGSSTNRRSLEVMSRNATAVFTSNVGEGEMQAVIRAMTAEQRKNPAQAFSKFDRNWTKRAAVEAGIPMAFMDRITGIEVALPPTPDELAQIIEMNLDKARALGSDQMKIDLDFVKVAEYVKAMVETSLQRFMSNRDTINAVKQEVKYWVSGIAMMDSYTPTNRNIRQSYSVSLENGEVNHICDRDLKGMVEAVDAVVAP